MDFRKDINGLRAIAVMAVVLFHFNSSWMPGGFAGVDVFFVISGFLMTGIIFRDIEQGNFSIFKFYVARANRIIPALSVLCLVLLILGWFFISPLDYKILGKHVISSIGFVSNITYFRESGYFDVDSHEKWLLHTWSLSAEWQFYIIYPLVLVAMRKLISVKAMRAAILFGTVLGFIFCVVATYKWPNPAYYLLPTRAWEMMIGGVAYLYPIALKKERKRLLEWFGLALIIGSYFFISKESPWPGYLAIFPVLGAFSLIQAQRNDSFITGNILSQKIGSWSYSIYLWHWPLVVTIYYFSLSDKFIYFGIALSILLGFISNKYIEKFKFRGDFTSIKSYLKFTPAYMVILVVGMGGIVFTSGGFDSRYSPEQKAIAINQSQAFQLRAKDYLIDYANINANDKYGNLRFVDDYTTSFFCTLDKKNQTKESLIDCLDYHLGDSGYLLVGDSHSRDFYNVMKMMNPDINVSALVQSGCVPTQYKNCFSNIGDLSLKEIILSYMKDKRIKGVIFSSFYNADLSVIDKFLGDVSEYSKLGNVFVVNAGPYNNGLVDRFHTVLDGKFNLNNAKNLNKIEINSRINEVLKAEDIIFIDKYDFFCDKLKCELLDGLTPLFADNHHLTVEGYRYWASYLNEDSVFN